MQFRPTQTVARPFCQALPGLDTTSLWLNGQCRGIQEDRARLLLAMCRRAEMSKPHKVEYTSNRAVMATIFP
jgi:hypothetical protein